MIAFFLICYGAIYFLIFNKLKWLEKSASNISAFIGVGVVLIASLTFSWFTYAPMTADARTFRHIIPIVPNVKGQVIAVPIKALELLAAGDTLYQIDPTPYQHTVSQLSANIAQLKAQKTLANIQVQRARKLVKTQAAAQMDLDKWTAELDAVEAGISSAEAQLANAQWQLQETTVKAPTNGYVVNLQIRPGTTVSNIAAASALAFISRDSDSILASYSQSAIRNIQPGDTAELVFVNKPGQVFSGKVFSIVAFGAQSQLVASGNLPTLSGAPITDRWAVRVVLDDSDTAQSLPQGSAATMAVYTSNGKAIHIISKVALRMNAWLAYLTSN